MQPLKAIEDQVETERELLIIIAAAETSVVTDRQGHFRDVRVGLSKPTP